MARSNLLCVAPCCNIEYHGRMDIAIAASDVCEERATKVGRGDLYFNRLSVCG